MHSSFGDTSSHSSCSTSFSLPPQDHTSLEQSVAQSQTMRAVIWPVQAVTEDIFIWTVRPRHSVNCLYLHQIEIFLFISSIQHKKWQYGHRSRPQICYNTENAQTQILTTGYWLRSLYVRPAIVFKCIRYSKLLISRWTHFYTQHLLQWRQLKSCCSSLKRKLIASFVFTYHHNSTK